MQHMYVSSIFRSNFNPLQNQHPSANRKGYLPLQTTGTHDACLTTVAVRFQGSFELASTTPVGEGSTCCLKNGCRS